MDEYRQKKAHFIWEERGKTVNNDDYRINKDYLDGCHEIEPLPGTANASVFPAISKDTLTAFADTSWINKHEMIKQKAYWLYEKTNNTDELANWNRASNYVNKLFRGLESLAKGKPTCDLHLLIKENLNMSSMFEYCIWYILLKSCGKQIGKGLPTGVKLGVHKPPPSPAN